MNRRQTLASLLCSAMVVGPARAVAKAIRATKMFDEVFRPQVHFTPAKNWNNDPNGLIWLDGEYHLFFQYNPFGSKWGHMSWGHAVSPDLLHWKELPVAIPEDDVNMIFSGCTVLDAHNTSGFGTAGRAPLVAVYTGHAQKDGLQTQCIAFSLDRGRTWTKYRGNPVIDLGLKEFRDPKVFWFEPAKTWVMIVARSADRKVAFYHSANLISWTLAGEFGPAGEVDGVWECPDLFELPVENRPGETKWVLKVDSSPRHAGVGCGGQAFVGTFDGSTFHSLQTFALDLGEDFYASGSWANLPKGRHVTIGWMSNPRYAGDTPTDVWRGGMSLPREVSLRAETHGYTLLQRPIRELASLQTRHTRFADLKLGSVERTLLTAGEKDNAHRIRARVKTNSSGGFAVIVSSGGKPVISIDFDAASAQLSVMRSGPNTIPSFVSSNAASLKAAGGVVSFDMIIDRSSVEAFVNDGERTICEQMFPDQGAYAVSINGDADTMLEADVWTLKPVWS
jgi:fructan beta-fructosidase